jgi:hypothetical protein
LDQNHRQEADSGRQLVRLEPLSTMKSLSKAKVNVDALFGRAIVEVAIAVSWT